MLQVDLPRSLAAFSQLNPGVEAFLQENSGSVESHYYLKLILEEAILNLVQHAKQASGIIQVQLTATCEAYEVCIVDDGEPFPPSAAAEFDAELGLDERRAGGMGIHLIKAFSEEVHYHSADGCNRLVVRLSRRSS